MKAVGGVRPLGQFHHGVLEGQQDAWVDFKSKVKVEGPVAGLLGVQVDFPSLAEGVSFDEMSLVVHVEPMVHGVVLELGDVPGYIDNGHRHNGSGTRAVN